MSKQWLRKNNDELDAKFKFKLMKTLWRHENAENILQSNLSIVVTQGTEPNGPL